MKQLLVLVALATYASGAWDGGFRVRFGIGFEPEYFVSMPQTVSAAESQGWARLHRPESPLPSLVLYCHESRIVCVMYDDTEYVAGFQAAFPSDKFSDTVYSWEVQGFSRWTPDSDGKVYWAIQQYFVNEEFMASSPESRVASRNPNKVLQLGSIWVTGIDKELLQISTNADEIAKSEFTEQACVPFMGRHHYYNVTPELPCNEKTMFPWFTLSADGELVGTGLVTYGKFPEDSNRDWCERPGRTAVEMIVPRGPQCIYELAENPGLVTMHIYYIDNPWGLMC